MPEDIKLISSRRAYEFGPDELRLTVLSTLAIQERVKQLFQFQEAGVGQLPETFGPVPPTLPPGVAFTLGDWISPEGTSIPIRLVHFEPRRIVFDVAGPSSAIDGIFAVLTKSLSTATAPDGALAIGTPHHTRDHSEIVAKLGSPISAILAPGVQDLLAGVMGAGGANSGRVLTPFVSVQVHHRDEEYPGAVFPDMGGLQLDLRAGTKPDEQVYYSAAPLDSEAHLRYLRELETLLAR